MDEDRTSKSKRTASLFKVIAALLLISSICFAIQYDNIKNAIRMRLFEITSDQVIKKEEIKEITKQAVTKIDIAKQESLNIIDDKTKEIMELDNRVASKDVVPEDVLKAVNKARKETR